MAKLYGFEHSLDTTGTCDGLHVVVDLLFLVQAYEACPTQR